MEEKELQEAKRRVKDDLFQFMSTVVQLVISFELSVVSSVAASEGAADACTIAAVMQHSQKTRRLGMMRLAALELLDKL